MGLEVLVGPFLNLMGKALGKVLGEGPTLEVWPERFMGVGAVYMYLKVHNPMPHKIHVLSVSVQPPLFQALKDQSVEAAAEGMSDIEPEFILEADEAKLLPLIPINRRDDGISEEARITVWWRSHRHPKRWKFPIWLDLTHDDFDRIERAG
jgi:hypothetical protein